MLGRLNEIYDYVTMMNFKNQECLAPETQAERDGEAKPKAKACKGKGTSDMSRIEEEDCMPSHSILITNSCDGTYIKQ